MPQPQAAEFTIAEARRALGEAFAPWVLELGLSIDAIECAPPPGATAEWQPGALLRMTFSERLCRQGGIVCGQALMSLADTAMVFAVSATAGSYLPMTTVDQTMHFLRPAIRSDLLAEARVVRLGRTMAFGSVSIRTEDDARPVALAQIAYALMRDNK